MRDGPGLPSRLGDRGRIELSRRCSPKWRHDLRETESVHLDEGTFDSTDGPPIHVKANNDGTAIRLESRDGTITDSLEDRANILGVAAGDTSDHKWALGWHEDAAHRHLGLYTPKDATVAGGNLQKRLDIQDGDPAKAFWNNISEHRFERPSGGDLDMRLLRPSASEEVDITFAASDNTRKFRLGYTEFNQFVIKSLTTTYLSIGDGASRATLNQGAAFNGGITDDVGGTVQQQRGAPITAELDPGERMQYMSDGSDGNSAGDLVSARNDSGTIVSQVIAPASNDA